MWRSNLEWILITGFILFHLLFLFVDSDTSTLLVISALFFLSLAVFYIVAIKSVMYTLMYLLSTGSVIGVVLNIEHIPWAQMIIRAGTAGGILLALAIAVTAIRNRHRINTSLILPVGLLVLMVAQLLFYFVINLIEYSDYLDYLIFLFSGHILLSRVSRGKELQSFYCSLKLVLLISGLSVLDQTISSL